MGSLLVKSIHNNFVLTYTQFQTQKKTLFFFLVLLKINVTNDEKSMTITKNSY